jgi:hypothetical protein
MCSSLLIPQVSVYATHWIVRAANSATSSAICFVPFIFESLILNSAMATAAQEPACSQSACLPCRQSKRRCDKRLPGCELCARKRIDCRYPDRGGNRNDHQTASSGAFGLTPDSMPSGGEHHDVHQITSFRSLPVIDMVNSAQCETSATYFLAPDSFQQARLELPLLDVPIPLEVSSTIGDMSSIRSIISEFFPIFHRWLPIISKQEFFGRLLNPLAKRRTELSLLTLVMKLCCTQPAGKSGPVASRSSSYLHAKRFYYEIELAGFLSLHVLQANIFIAFYEFSHAIYPAAHLTVGACARYAMALGIDKHDSSTSKAAAPRMFSDIEEARRAWWTIVMLDRFLSLNDPLRSLSTPDPTFNTYLPVDDAAWDNGTAHHDSAVTISTGFTLQMGNFARMAQSTFLLSQALRAIKSEIPHADGNSDETAQIRRTLLALVHATDSEATLRKLEFCAQSALSLR